MNWSITLTDMSIVITCFFRVYTSEKEIQGQKDSKLVEWRNKLAFVEDWLAEENEKLGKDKNSVDGLASVTKQKREMEVVRIFLRLWEKKFIHL